MVAVTQKWTIPSSIATIFGSDIDSKTNGTYTVSAAAVDNSDGTTGLLLYADFELFLASLTPSGGGYCALYLSTAIDGTNYSEQTTPPATQLIATFPLRAAAATQRVPCNNVLLPPVLFKWIFLNSAGVTLATGNTVKVRYHFEQSV